MAFRLNSIFYDIYGKLGITVPIFDQRRMWMPFRSGNKLLPGTVVLILILFSGIFSCGKGREGSKPVFEFERQVGGDLTFDLPGVVSVKSQSTPREYTSPLT